MIAVPHYISFKDYLEIERDSLIRHEYRYGLVYAMTGGTGNHNRIALNLATIVTNHLEALPGCYLYGSDTKVKYENDFSYYPDAFVTCDPRDLKDDIVKRYPKLIVEVLSKSTEKFDFGDKFEDYKKLDSLEEYVLVSQDMQRVEVWRCNDKAWHSTVYLPGDSVTFESLDITFDIGKLYFRTI